MLKHSRNTMRLDRKLLAAALCAWFANTAAAGEDFSIPWYSIDSGGEMFSSGGEFELSGTIGQWDATEARQLSGGDWRLTGGFWGLTLGELASLLFSDRFEAEE